MLRKEKDRYRPSVLVCKYCGSDLYWQSYICLCLLIFDLCSKYIPSILQNYIMAKILESGSDSSCWLHLEVHTSHAWQVRVIEWLQSNRIWEFPSRKSVFEFNDLCYQNRPRYILLNLCCCRLNLYPPWKQRTTWHCAFRILSVSSEEWQLITRTLSKILFMSKLMLKY